MKKNIFNRLFLVVFLLFLAYFSIFKISTFKTFAATGINKQVSFQGKVVNTDGTNVTSGNYDMEFKIYYVATGGTAIWTETRTGGNQVAVTDGIFQVNLGSVTALPGAVDFNSDSIYLSINFNNNGEMDSRVRFTSTPYAMNAGKVAGLTVTDTTGTLTIPSGRTVAFADAFTTSGTYGLTLTTTNTTNVTLPTTGILSTLSGTETFVNKTIGASGLIFSGASIDVDTTAAEGLVLQGRAASTFQTTSGNIILQPGGTGIVASVQIGAGGTGSTAPDFFGLDVKSTSGDPVSGGYEGAMYYNTFDNKFRCYQDTAWTDCIGSAGVTSTGTANYITKINAANNSLVNSLLYDNGTNVGVGTTATTAKLNVAGNLSASYLIDYENNAYGMDPAGTTNFGGYSLKVTGGSLLAQDSGNVGIGTTNPGFKFTLGSGQLAVPNGSAGAPSITFGNYPTTGFHYDSNFGGGIAFDVPAGRRAILGSLGVGLGSTGVFAWSPNVDLASGTIDTGLSRGGIGKVYVGNGTAADFSGTLIANNVGIGMTDPGAYKLNVNGNVNITGSMNITAGITAPTTVNTINGLIINAGALSNITTLGMNNQLSNSYANVAAINLTGNGAGITFTGSNPNTINTATGVNLALMPGTTGNVGIGTTAPLFKLDVNGNSRVGSTAFFASSVGVGISVPTGLFQVNVGATNALFVKTNGNVGIGTTAPGYKMEINGNLSLNELGLISETNYVRLTNGRAEFGYDGTQQQAYFGGGIDKSLAFRGNGVTLMAMNSIGNFGIGTTNPLNKLHVEGTNGAAAGIYLNQAVPSSTSSTLYNNGGALYWNGSAVGGGGGITSTGATGYIPKFTTSSTLGNSLLYETGTGISIGRTNPGSKLEVNGDARIGDGTNFANFSTTGDLSFVGTADYLVGDNRYAFRYAGGENYGLMFNTSVGAYEFKDGSANGIFTIDANTGQTFILSNVGIGTTAPLYKLEVNGGMKIGSTAYFASSVGIGTDTPNGLLEVNGRAKMWSVSLLNPVTDLVNDSPWYGLGVSDMTLPGSAEQAVVQVGGYYGINFATSAGNTMTLHRQGNLGIGTTNPLNRLHVEGTNGGAAGIYLNQAIPSGTANTLYNNGGALYWNGSAVGGGGGVSSTGATGYISRFTGVNSIGNSLIFDNGTSIGIGSTAFDSINPEKLFVDAGTTTSVTALGIEGSINNYLQLNLQNKSVGNSASSDIVATANNGTETTNYINMGINSSIYASNIVGSSNDAYLYSAGNNMLIGNATVGKDLIFFTNGTNAYANERMRIDDTGNVGIGTTNPQSKLEVIGNIDATGQIQMGSGTSAPTALGDGAMYYNSTTKKAQLYENGTWKNMVSTGSTGKVKSTTQGATASSTAWNNDSELFFAMAPSKTYYVSANIDIMIGNTAADAKYSFSIPTNTTISMMGIASTASATNTMTQCNIVGNTTPCTLLVGATARTRIQISGTVTTNSSFTTGNLQFVFSQNTSTGATFPQILAGSILEVTDSTNYGADLAEMYNTNDETIVSGDVVSIDPELDVGVRKSKGRYDPQILGVISTKPGLILHDGEPQGKSSVLVALSGRIPVNVSTENGEIKVGDYLTSSSVPGVAMKATKSGYVIAQAMVDYSGEGTGTVLAFIKNTYFNGIMTAEGKTGVEILTQLTTDQSLITKPDVDLSEIMTDRLVAGLEIISPKVVTKDLVASNITGEDAYFSGTITANKIRANQIEGLEIMTSQISLLKNKFDDLSLDATTSAVLGSTAPAIQPDTPDTISMENVKVLLSMEVLGSLQAKGGIVVAQEARFKGETVFEALANFFGKVIFNAKAVFVKTPLFNQDAGGVAVIKKDMTTVYVKFNEEYEGSPVVNANVISQKISDEDLKTLITDKKCDVDSTIETCQAKLEKELLENNFKYIISDIDSKGFKITISQKAPFDIVFNWSAMAIDDLKKVESQVELNISPTNVPISVFPTPLHQDSAGQATTTPSPTPETVIIPTTTLAPTPTPVESINQEVSTSSAGL